jgi:hypothetical protein
MKVSETYRQLLDEASPHGWPEGPPNIELRTGMKVSEAYWQLLEEASPDGSPEGPPNIKLHTGLNLRRKLADFLAAAFRASPVQR